MYLETHRHTGTPLTRDDGLAAHLDRIARESAILPTVSVAEHDAEALQRRVRALRAEAFAEVARRVARGVRRGVVRAVAGVRDARERRAARRDLERLDDRLLADIGVARGDIPAVVDGIIGARRRPAPAGSTGAEIVPLATRRFLARTEHSSRRDAA